MGAYFHDYEWTQNSIANLTNHESAHSPPSMKALGGCTM